MSSVVADILNSAGGLTKEDIPSKVENLRKQIEDIKLEIQESLKSRYLDFMPRYLRLDKLVKSLEAAKDEYEMLQCHVEKEVKPEMSNSVSEYHELFDEMKKIKALKQVVSSLIEMHRNLVSASCSTDQRSYLSAAECLLKFESEAKAIGLNEKKDVEIFGAMKTKYYIAKENTIYHLGEEWKKKVSVSFKEKSVTHPSKAELIIDLQKAEELSDIIQSLESLGQFESKLKSFGKQFIELICEPIVCKNVEMNVMNSNEVMCISVSPVEDSSSTPSSVCNDLEQLFRHLNGSLFSWTVTNARNKQNGTKQTIMERFGECSSQELCSKLIEKSLKPSVPSKSQELKTFQQCIMSAKNLEKYFCEIGFLKTEDNPIYEFIGNVDELPANKMSIDLLSHARELMKQDLHQTVHVGENEAIQSSTLGQPVATSPAEELQQVAKLKSGLSKNTFAFPACQISVSAKNLVKLLHQVLEESKTLQAESPMYSTKLFYTARSICELYCCIVPLHHKEQITSIPQQTAIFHNNCMYIAHCLLTLGQTHQKVNLSCPVTFIDLVPEIRRIGTEAFLAQMRAQRQILLQLLQDPGVFQNMAQDEELVNKAEKIVRQCLCQLELLKRVWADVLPVEVYFKAMGTLLNTFMEEIILLVTSMEDIAAQVAAQLDSIFDIVFKHSPELFKVKRGDKRDIVHKYVRRWFKFQELQTVLNASLMEIVDRWASGKGPLATHFTVDETKHLIRALFQNTEKRAAALGKIR